MKSLEGPVTSKRDLATERMEEAVRGVLSGTFRMRDGKPSGFRHLIGLLAWSLGSGWDGRRAVGRTWVGMAWLPIAR
jgi:hypothetical protein